MIKARTQLLLHHPFFGYFLTHLKFAGDALNLGVSTACVEWDRNAKKYLSYLHYNPDFISILSVEEVQGVEAHEMMHILLQNEQRKENRDEGRYSRACEIAVNDTVLNAGFSLPRREDFSPILPDQTTHNKTVEEIYDLLPPRKEATDEEKKFMHVISTDKQASNASRSDIIDTEGIDEKKLKEIVSEAAAYARIHCKLPAGMERWIDDYLTPKMNWLQLLDHYIYNAMTTMTYSWTRPNRRLARSKLYLPSTVRYGFELVVCVDTSGSISSENLAQFASEIKSIVNSIQGCTAHVIVCDADLYSVYDDIGESNFEQLKFGGGGGTNFVPALEKAMELDPRVCVYLTDGDGEYPKEEPSFPVIWVITPDGVSEEQVPFGMFVKMPAL
jgi:predicted metal-dependent peptidase